MNNYTQKQLRKEVLKNRDGIGGIVKTIFEELPLFQKLKKMTKSGCKGLRERIFTPWFTIKTFLMQVMDQDQSCQQAVHEALSEQVILGGKDFSSNTAAYCKARTKLPEAMISDLAKKVGETLHDGAEQAWEFMGRKVKLVDGSTISMPDTPENQEEYKQPDTQEEGVGFPIARIVAMICLATGTILDLAIGPYQGKKLENMRY